MPRLFSQFLDAASEFLARRKGLLPIVGILLVIFNGVLQFIPGSGAIVETNIFLHLGVIIAVLGIMLAWAL
ncbi:MAG: hypothetical protein IMY85_05165 [Chloroflexi bacterium]|nr:hypothetical protein [Chloroflexota bacterium]